MTLTWWSMAFLVAIFAATLTTMIWGARLFSPQRARNVKHVERDKVVVARVIEVVRNHPEIIKIGRIDRHPAFLFLHACVFGYSLSVFCGAKLTSNVVALGDSPRYTMATCFIIGSSLVLIGATLGIRVGRWRVGHRIHNHLTSEVLGDDIVLPYRLSMAGMGAMIVSSSIYWCTSFQSTFGSLGGWLTLAISLICITCIPWFFTSISRFEKWDRILVSEAQTRIDAGDSDAD